jgi:hypothetical protein
VSSEKTIKGLDASHSVTVSAKGGLPPVGVWMQHPGFNCHDYFTAEQAREFAGILVRAADEADALLPAMDLAGVLEGSRLGQPGGGT